MGRHVAARQTAAAGRREAVAYTRGTYREVFEYEARTGRRAQHRAETPTTVLGLRIAELVTRGGAR